ncbi:MAG: GGDEF domain-containing protein [Pseudomonadota bacterium]
MPASTTNTLPTDLQQVRLLGIKRFWLTLPSYGAVMAILWVGVILGIVHASIAFSLCFITIVTLMVFYGLLHSGKAARSKDPLLTYAQMLLNIVMVACGYAALDDLRSTALLWLSVIIVFDVWRLKPRQILVAAVLCVLLPLLATAVRARWHPSGLNDGHELFTLLILMVVLPILFAVSAQARAMRKRHIQQKEQMTQALAQLHQLSIRDGLTGLYNRRHMLDLLEEEVRRWQRSGQPFCIAILDLDWFKRVNDQYGHATGDAVLQTFAQLGMAAFPGTADALARWGGEEFLLLQPQTTAGESVAALMQLRDQVHHHDWTLHGEGLSVTFSAGVCQHHEGSTLEQTLEKADQALYQAKAGGRDGIFASEAAPSCMPVALNTSVAEPRPLARHTTTTVAAHAEPSAATPRPTAPTPTPPDRQKTPVPGPTLVQWILGRDDRLRVFQYMSLLGACVYLTSIAGFLLYVAPAKILTHQQTMLFVGHNLLAAVVPFTLLRLGVTARWRDPSFVLPQILWGGTGVIIGYAMMPATSPSTLQMICLSLVFGFSSLRPHETLFVGKYYIALMLGVLGMKAVIGADNFSPSRDILEVAMTCIALWMLTAQSHRFSVHRDRVRAEKRSLADATAQVNQIMMHDPLTGLYNRQHMQQMLERECDRHQRTGTSFCIALIDLDHFKTVNDTHGHAVGDEVLVGFAKIAQSILRETDVVCRWGGEEFLVLLVDTNPGQDGLLALNRLREAVAQQAFCPSSTPLRVTMSAGMAEHLQDEPITSTLARADHALYAAKAAGRNRCVCSGQAQSSTMSYCSGDTQGSVCSDTGLPMKSINPARC